MPYGVHHIGNIYSAGTSTFKQGRGWVRAVTEPYWCSPFERLRAAWYVLTGRAEAIVWPKPGDLETALRGDIGESDA